MKFKQDFSAMPKELTEAPRWFKVGEDKTPLTKAWSNPDNQKRYTELSGVLGFDTCGHDVGDDYCLLDLDHIFYGDGKLKERVDQHGILQYALNFGWYVEKSISGTGAHILIKPTPGKFGKITTKEGVGVLHFGGEAKLEIFYGSEGRYCLLTGNKLEKSGDEIPAGKYADNLLETLLKEIHTQFQAATLAEGDVTPKQAPKAAKAAKAPTPKICAADSPEYEAYRVNRMIDCVPIADLRGDDWLAVMTALKNFGMSYAEVDSLNRGGETYNEAENLRRWDSITAGGDWLGALHNLAKQYGYAEADTLREWRQANPSTPAQIRRADRQKKSGNAVQFDDETRQALYGGDFTDVDFADRIEYLFGDEIRHIIKDNEWYLLERNEFGGAVWKNCGDKKSCVYSYARRLADMLLANATPIPAEVDGFKVVKEKVKKGIKYSLELARQSLEGGGFKVDLAAHRPPLEKLGAIVAAHKKENGLGNRMKISKHISAAVEMLKGSTAIQITPDDLNCHTNLLNCLNGVVDLENGKFYAPHEQLKFLPTNQVAACYDTRCDSAFVEKFLSEILPDEATCAAVKRYCGYALTGDKRFHIAELWRGSGANGKSTLLDALLKLFGSYATKLPNLALIQSTRPLDANAATPCLAMLNGDIRLAVIDELLRGVRLNGELFKTILGDETAKARFLHQNFMTVQLRAKLILNGNFLPAFDVDDKAIIRRINRVEFTQHFDVSTADPLLPHKLGRRENLDALLKILVFEARQFYHDGLLESSAMAEAKREYIAENDFVADFIEARLVVGDGGQILRKTLEEKICAEYPAETRRLKKKEIFDMLRLKLEERGAEYAKLRTNANVFKNVKLVDE